LNRQVPRQLVWFQLLWTVGGCGGFAAAAMGLRGRRWLRAFDERWAVGEPFFGQAVAFSAVLVAVGVPGV
jgi:hypothetical protein